MPGVSRYVIRSLKTRDLPTALNQAEDLFYELRAEQKLGMDVRVSGNLKFKDLWKRFYAAHESGLSVHGQRLHKFMAEKYFNPYLGEARVDRLKKLSRHSAPDDLVFCGYDGKPVENFNKTFASILSRLKLLDDRWGKRRTVYSLRHFYCTQCLLFGIPVHVLTVMQGKELRTKKFKAKA